MILQGRVSALLLLGVGAICGCAYFNGLYNANQLVNGAIRAEREGRVGEARSLWSQAAVKAESVAVRYGESRHYDDALLLQGRALRAAGQCRSAVDPLNAAIASSSDTNIVEQANFYIGLCQLSFGRVDSAIASFSRTLPSEDTLLASVAHLWRGRAYARLGAYGAAIVDFSASSLIDAAFDLAVAHARLGQRADAERVLRWRVDGEFSETLWLATLDTIGTHLQNLASNIVDQLLERPRLSRDERGTLLLSDGDRWAAEGEVALAMARYQAVLDTDPSAGISDAARFRGYSITLQSVSELAQLPAWLDSLSGITDADGTISTTVDELTAVVAMAVMSLQGHESDGGPGDSWRLQNPDLEMFLAAEALRDRAHASLLATAMFEEVFVRFPTSQLAPKALLAAAALNPGSADSLFAVVRRNYPRSPYTFVLNGYDSDAYAMLEDSLRTLILAKRGAT